EWKASVGANINCGGKGYYEVKACVNCVFDGNVFTGCSGGSNTVRNQSMDFPWASISGLTFSNNYYMNSDNDFVVFGQDAVPTKSSQNITFTNNLMVGWRANANNPNFLGGRAASAFWGAGHVTITHNSVLWANLPYGTDGVQWHNYWSDFPSRRALPITNFTMQNNFFGMAGNACTDFDNYTSVPMPNCWPSAVIDHNVFIHIDGYIPEYINQWWGAYPNNWTVTD